MTDSNYDGLQRQLDVLADSLAPEEREALDDLEGTLRLRSVPAVVVRLDDDGRGVSVVLPPHLGGAPVEEALEARWRAARAAFGQRGPGAPSAG